MPEHNLSETLARIDREPLGSLPAELSAKVVRRIVDNEELNPRLDVAAFNSAS